MKLIVFDWDGTLADSTALIVRALQQSCRDMQLPIPSDTLARYVIGLGLRDTLTTVAPTLTEARYPDMVAAFKKNFLEGEDDIVLFDGVTDMLTRLNDAGALLGIATGKSRPGLDRALNKLGIKHQFVASRCADEGRPKPHPEMLLHVVNTCGADLDRTLMVGDTTHDMQLAANAGVRALAVSYGAHDAEPLFATNPIAVVGTIPELHTRLLHWYQHG
jgi:phosphoglycolate phosphatase